jgi:hypothetical protein
MKPGRNDPCPCGSGKKYKKCCYLLGFYTTDIDNTIESEDIEEIEDIEEDDYIESGDTQDDDDYYNEQEFFINALNNIRGYLLEKKPHIKEYYKLRNMHGEIVNTMIQYHYDGKFKKQIDTDVIPKTEPGETREVHILESDFDFETQLGIESFYDMWIYKMSPNVNCITDDFIQKHRYRNPEKIELLHSMLNSKLGLFEITGTDEKEGYVYLKNVFSGTECTIIDIGLSGSTNYDSNYIYLRIISHHGINFGSGLNFHFRKTDDFIKEHIQQHKTDFNPDTESIRFTQLYNYYSQDPNRVRVVINEL